MPTASLLLMLRRRAKFGMKSALGFVLLVSMLCGIGAGLWRIEQQHTRIIKRCCALKGYVRIERGNAAILAPIRTFSVELVSIQDDGDLVKCLRSLSELPRIEMLQARPVMFEDRFASDTPACVSQVWALSIADGRLTAECCRNIAAWTCIRELHVWDCVVEPGAMRELSRSPNLVELWFSDVRVEGNLFANLHQPSRLETVTLDRLALGADDWRAIGEMRGLRYLSARDSNFCDADFAALKTCIKLQRLDLRTTAIHGERLAALAGLRDLEYLDLSKCGPFGPERYAELEEMIAKITGKDIETPELVLSLAALPELPSLRELNVAGARIGPSAWEGLRRQANLTRLDCTGAKIPAWIKDAMRRKLPKLKVDE
jgi:hypothetical protein